MAESLLASKLGLIPKFMFDKKQLEHIRTIFIKQNITIELDEHIYNLLLPSCYTFNTKLLFNVKIPIFDTQMYHFIHTIPLPINSSYFIMSPEFLAYHDDNIYKFKDECLKAEHDYFCPKVPRENVYSGNKCLLDLINGRKQVKCDMIDTEPNTKIFEAEKGIIFIFNGQNILIKSNCQEDTYVNGSVILQ